jgi:transposase
MMNASARVTDEPEAGDRPQRRKHSIVEKRGIVEATLVVGASVARVAREHGVNANQVFGWRRLYQRGLLGSNAPSVALVPVKVREDAAVPVPAEPVATAAAPSTGSIRLQPTTQGTDLRRASAAAARARSGTIQLRLPKRQLRVDGAVDAALLRVPPECRKRPVMAAWTGVA